MSTKPGSKLPTKVNRLSELARQNPTRKFTSLAQLLDEEALNEAYRELNPQTTVGIDHVDYKALRTGSMDKEDSQGIQRQDIFDPLL